MPNFSRHISNRLFRLWLAVLLLSCLPITDFGAQKQVGVRGESIGEECVTKHDGLHRYMMQERQMPLAGIVITAKNGERIGSSRPVRLNRSTFLIFMPCSFAASTADEEFRLRLLATITS